MLFKNPESRYIHAIFVKIQEYNKKQDENAQIQFLHGGSSALFAFIGLTIAEKTIPAALIPTGILRKKYGVYPVSGEQEIGVYQYGERKAALNYQNLSGMDTSLHGVTTTYDYANNSKRIISRDKLHENILIHIKYMTIRDYVRSLKMLLLDMTNLVLLFPESRRVDYFQLLELRRAELVAQHPDSKDIDAYFSKYVARLSNIINMKDLSFVANEEFRDIVLNQYPVIFCSTVKATDLYGGVPEEKFVKGEISLQTIKMMFTPHACVDDLKTKLNLIGLEGIEVAGYETLRSFKSATSKRPSLL